MRLALVLFLVVLGPLSLADETLPFRQPLRDLTAHDRVLVLAPHPDDESLGAGGIIQRAVAAHAAIRVVFLTNGDNNEWAQRFIEHRLVIGPRDKARWGARRQKEAMHALQTLGVPLSDAVFLGFHDCGTTALLMQNDPAFVSAIASSIVAWHPTVLVLPTPDDLHPDHNTGWVITHVAYFRENVPLPFELDYLVHTNGRITEPEHIELHLTPQEKQVKHNAILCHNTQMSFGHKRWTSYAKDIETFFPAPRAAAYAPRHPLVNAVVREGGLRLDLSLKNARGLREAAIDVVTEGPSPSRFEIPIPSESATVPITDSATGKPAGAAAFHWYQNDVLINIPIPSPARHVFVKFDHQPVFFDTAGWREAAIRP